MKQAPLNKPDSRPLLRSPSLSAHRRQGRAAHLSLHPERRRISAQAYEEARPLQAFGPAPSLQAASSNGAHQHDLTLCVRSHWHQTFVHYSLQGSKWRDSEPLARAPKVSGTWHILHLQTQLKPARPSAPLLEFVLHNGHNEWARAASGNNFVVTEAGRYAVNHGVACKVEGEAMLLVSDLDDTMIGDDDATAAFKAFWEEDASLRGSVLVYNTGRALNKFLSLWEEKKWCMALPDVLISSVGTKIFRQSAEEGWMLDEGFAKVLDDGWNLEAVRETAYACLARAGKDKMHFRPPDEQNDHKITCGVHVDVLDEVQRGFRKALEDEQLRVRIMISGRGEWRFLDVVSHGAGKLSALEYVRRLYGVAPSATIACGDSGNDLEVLAGERNLAIVVGNSEPDLKAWAAKEVQQRIELEGRPRLYAAELNTAYGILEGLEFWGFKRPASNEQDC